ncbi:hypothetical protein, unlikely [Trypanosoma brucei brucei TREU927]|uniref:Uncharacterized protein n=1 Tax=Trypanosoma brucei brucei (strain 927/4 GUTat10.1) TaxID=185431 RepID=Q38CN4_TRYB2|nr:hypothetical protein, unlikely [Trypanosoma brucei brucei TREU927]EAN77436.1 hypothetical protein, unlikely [Trypanosoma brucei brucei TREU927]
MKETVNNLAVTRTLSFIQHKVRLRAKNDLQPPCLILILTNYISMRPRTSAMATECALRQKGLNRGPKMKQ